MSEHDLIVNYSDDITNAERPEPLPIGQYNFEIRSVEIAVSGKGMPYAVPKYFIDPSQYPADFIDGDPDGTTIRGFVSLEDNKVSRARMRKFCEAIEAPMGVTLDLNEWNGLNGIVDIVHQEYEGEIQANAKKISAA